MSRHAAYASEEFFSLVRARDYPCVMAKASVLAGKAHVIDAGSFSPREDEAEKNLRAIYAALKKTEKPGKGFHSVVLLFDDTPPLSEETFEKLLWEYLAALHAADRRHYAWDSAVSSDPSSSKFSFSLMGKAFYVIGMHPGSGRKSRRTHKPAIVFNLHRQFEALRERGDYVKIRDAIRNRDAAYSGSHNPMAENFGEASEALQYSGRHVDKDSWTCPFHPSPSAPRRATLPSFLPAAERPLS